MTSLISLFGEDGRSGPGVAAASPTPDDFPGHAPAPHAKEPQQRGERPDQSSAPPSEHATESLARAQDERAGRPDYAGQRSQPRQENPVEEHGKSQDTADPTNTAKT